MLTGGATALAGGPVGSSSSPPPVAVDTAGEVVGFALLSPYKERAGYRTSVEDSVYVDRAHHGRGVGRLLLDDLIRGAALSGFHAVFARITASSEPPVHCTPHVASSSSASNGKWDESSTSGWTSLSWNVCCDKRSSWVRAFLSCVSQRGEFAHTSLEPWSTWQDGSATDPLRVQRPPASTDDRSAG